MKTGIAIQTRYFGPTNTKGSRFVATCKKGTQRLQMTLPYDYTLSATENHVAVAETLLARLGISEPLGEATPTRTGYVFTVGA